MMKKLLFSLLLASLFLNAIGQFEIKKGTYTTFNGQAVTVYKVEGTYTVLKVDTAAISHEQLRDTVVLTKIVERLDSYYTSYKAFCGKEPAGGDSEYNFKSSVAFASPSCGAACGLVGSKGIEVTPGMFKQVFNEIKNRINTNRIGIVGYEFGRNFFTTGGKLLFPYTPGTDERNGGFAEGFATTAGLIADLAYLTKQDIILQRFQDTEYYYQQLKRFFLAYINDRKANPLNALAKDYQNSDINRNTWGFDIPAYYAASILIGVNEIFKAEDTFSRFFKNLEDRGNVSTIEEALGNITYCFSKSLNYNLLPLFQNVLKFSIDQGTADLIRTLPLAPNRLIYDQPELWFTTPFDTIPLNVRSINYLNQGDYYQLFIDDSLVSETADGNNQITYSQLKNRASVILTVKLLDSNKNEVDHQQILLKKRTDIDLVNSYQDFTFSDTYGYCRPSFADGVFSIVNLMNQEAWPGLAMPFPLKRNRTIQITGQVKNERYNYPDMKDSLGNYKISSFAGIGFPDGSLRVGYDLAKDDSLNFHNLDFTINTNDFFNGDWSLNLEFVAKKFYLWTVGITNGYFKNIIYKDITDTDTDGVIDFEDPCPDVYGEDNGCPKVSTVPGVVVNQEIITYPNPVLDKLTIQNGENCKFSIYDIWGKLLLQEVITKPEAMIDVSKLPQGSYLIHFVSANRIQTGRFIKL